MISVVGWGLIAVGAWVAREVARARKEAAVPAPAPVPVRVEGAHRPRK